MYLAFGHAILHKYGNLMKANTIEAMINNLEKNEYIKLHLDSLAIIDMLDRINEVDLNLFNLFIKKLLKLTPGNPKHLLEYSSYLSSDTKDPFDGPYLKFLSNKIKPSESKLSLLTNDDIYILSKVLRCNLAIINDLKRSRFRNYGDSLNKLIICTKTLTKDIIDNYPNIEILDGESIMDL